MSDKKTMQVDESRRKFLETAGKAAAVAPAAGLLMAASKTSQAQGFPYEDEPPTTPPDSFT
ncbi:MAG: hypothetical protein ABW079_06600 [Sedimenticola sp.]